MSILGVSQGLSSEGDSFKLRHCIPLLCESDSSGFPAHRVSNLAAKITPFFALANKISLSEDAVCKV